MTIKRLNDLKITNRISLSYDFNNSDNYINSLIQFNNDLEFNIIKLLKDKTYEIYIKNIKSSNILNNAYTKLKNKDYIDENDPNISKDLIWQGIGATFGELSIWLTQYFKELKGFDKLNHQDLINIIGSVFPFLYGIHISCFYDDKNNECSMILSNSIQTTKKRFFQQLTSHDLVDLIFLFYYLFKKLNLTDTEKALFYPFILFGCNQDMIKDKENYFRIKYYYTKCIIYQFHLNKRDSIFYQNFNDLLKTCSLVETYKEFYFD